jgi:hypothetical protein
MYQISDTSPPSSLVGVENAEFKLEESIHEWVQQFQASRSVRRGVFWRHSTESVREWARTVRREGPEEEAGLTFDQEIVQFPQNPLVAVLVAQKEREGREAAEAALHECWEEPKGVRQRK